MSESALLQVRYAHKGFDVPLERLGVCLPVDERKLKQALARHLVVPISWLNSFVVERQDDCGVVLRETVLD